MPKVRTNEEEMKNRVVRAYISKYIELYNMSASVLALKIGISERTFQNKRKRPETFTLRELRKLCVVLKMPDEEKSELL